MSDPRYQVDVSVVTRFLAEQSQPEHNRFAFAYTIAIIAAALLGAEAYCVSIATVAAWCVKFLLYRHYFGPLDFSYPISWSRFAGIFGQVRVGQLAQARAVYQPLVAAHHLVEGVLVVVFDEFPQQFPVSHTGFFL